MEKQEILKDNEDNNVINEFNQEELISEKQKTVEDTVVNNIETKVDSTNPIISEDNNNTAKEITKPKVETNNTLPKPIPENTEVQTTKQEKPTPEPPKIETPAKQEIWDILGMSEYHYYNEPMYSWEHVDFKTMDECLVYGDKYEPYLNGEVLYNCRDVVSTSGNFLGVMFDTEKLN